jgi:hypothetical protein
MDKWLLRFVKLFNRLFIAQGIDTDSMYAIVETKLMMDRRRVYMNWRQRQQQENTNHLTIVLAVYALFGIIVGMVIFFLPSFLIAMVLVHAYLIFMMSMTLITDFSSVLLDTADNQVLLPRPVTSKTFFMARLVHILVYLLQFTIALSLAPIIFTFVKYGILTGMAICITSLLSVLVAVFFTYLLYLLILRFSSEEKVREVVTYFQIGMTVFFSIGYQILPRLININKLIDGFQLHWYSYLLPPVWMAMMLEAVHSLSFDGIHIVMSVIALLVPLFLFWFMVRYLAPSFSRKLAAINTDGTKSSRIGSATEKSEKFLPFVSGLFCRTNVEKGMFELTWKMVARDRSFKLQFYPAMAYIVFFIFIFVFQGGQGLQEVWERLPDTDKFLAIIYIPLLSVSGGIVISTFNENFQASWIYYSAPVANPGEIITGSVKALFVKFFIPVYLLLFVFCIYIWGLPVIDDFIFGFFNNALCFFVFALLSQHYLPFSRQPSTRQQTGRFITVMLQLIIMAALVGIHYFLKKYLVFMYIGIAGVVALCWLMVRNLQRISWQKISV